MHATSWTEFSIGGDTIAPGHQADIALPITTMATGYDSQLAVRVLHGARPGPIVFISGAIHGDELNGTAIIHRLAAQIDASDLAGTLLLVPVANIFGFLNHTRYLPDRRDLNRSFPGSAGGSLAAQVANVFFSEIVARASLGIDIHTAAIHRYNLPQIRIAAGNKRLAELAKAFAAPVIVESPLRDGSLRALAAKEGVDMLLMETGEALRFDRFSIETGVAGVKRVLAHLEMIEPDADLPEPHPSARSTKTQWVRSPRGGVSHRARKSGDAVKQGDLLAAVTGLFGEEPEEILSPVDGIIIGHATLPVVHQGDAMFHIAHVENPERVGERIETLSDAIYAGEPEGFAEALLDEDEVL
ncbi:succinylglutamate desuccinylase/aspartoacylase family protein [Erythrobacter sp. SCSIO 43205]|uniref:succinylglutamate desuccinylase/aspartoacylase family protein n=1 Tax=Erythrobacter sp. SCSIO 43205 TaxID=2779361 RepID=UPI001CA8E4AE|nr:succinylglutamate desuccinylase/aspartoacylase family protein [Erythrobacter sp. SCSIO 43205]UAB77416.1 succinylglutamate desuccinylase/aspartoacylase family protein [Erythrobacter sp. SCSIO 43205]